MNSKDFLKKYSGVPNYFIDELFEFYNETTKESDPVIDLYIVAKWLHSTKRTLKKKLVNSYEKNIDYIEKNAPNPDRTKYGNNYKQVLITPDTFKRICMLSRTKKAEEVRSYFIEIEQTFFKYRQQLINGIEKEANELNKLQKPNNKGYIYVIKASEEKDSVYKIGRTTDLKTRLRNHNAAHANDLEVMYRYRTDDVVAVEGCLKSMLKKYQFKKYKEVYQANIDVIKSLIDGCDKLSLFSEYRNKKPLKNNGGFYVVTEIRSDT